MTDKKKLAAKAAKPAAKQYIVLEAFLDRSGKLWNKGDLFPVGKLSAEELKTYATAENKIGRAVIAEK